MNDFNDDSKFSFGKVELGVVPSVKVSSANHVSYYHKNSWNDSFDRWIGSADVHKYYFGDQMEPERIV